MKKFKYISFDVEEKDIINWVNEVPENSIITDSSIVTLAKDEEDYNIYKLHWAGNSISDIVEQVNKLIHKKGKALNRITQTNFSCKDFYEPLKKIGFILKTHYRDYWLDDLNKIQCIERNDITIKEFGEDDLNIILQISEECKDSYGWIVATKDFFTEWNSNSDSKIFVAEKNRHIIGYICTSIYGQNSVKGPIVWIREVAVLPEYRGRKIATGLICKALNWGKANGAKRSFLATDPRTGNFEYLYKPLGYKINENDDGEYIMFLNP